jgi:hypothetical protein
MLGASDPVLTRCHGLFVVVIINLIFCFYLLDALHLFHIAKKHNVTKSFVRTLATDLPYANVEFKISLLARAQK